VNFIDEITITVESGSGGKGCVSFRRERSVPLGGPDGGDGGKGADVVFRSTLRRRSLQQFQFKKLHTAVSGKGGKGRRKTGKSGDDLILEIPPGTIVSDAETGELLYDFSLPDQTFVVAKGGRGGQGNSRFKTSRHQAPRFAQPGEDAETLLVKLELKLIADVGIVGLPNVGKSTLISTISSARPKIGSYPFTTLSPNLGVVQTGYGEPFVIADIPGLIPGAHEGAGLGIKFLRHIERTRILVHLIDVLSIDPDDPLEAYNAINNELSMYDAE
jgi:GTP-binding protein